MIKYMIQSVRSERPDRVVSRNAIMSSTTGKGLKKEETDVKVVILKIRVRTTQLSNLSVYENTKAIVTAFALLAVRRR